MRGDDLNQTAMFSYLSCEERVPENHPLRPIREMCNRALVALSPKFHELYSGLGRNSIAPEKLMRALILQALYSVRSERLLMEDMEYNLLFRWFVGLNVDEKVWDPTVFSKNRERLMKGEIAQAFFEAVLEQARQKNLLSDEHFTVDGTLLEAWASKKSYQKKEQEPSEGSGARGKVLLRDTHECTTDPDAQMYRKSTGGAFQLSHMAHVLMDNRYALPVRGMVTEAKNSAEWDAATQMLDQITEHGARHVTVGADSAYDYERFTQAARAGNVTPHVAQHQNRSSSIDGRTTRHPGYAISLKVRKRIEPIFGWLKNVAGQRKVRHRGRALVEWNFILALSAYNMVRMRTLAVQAETA
jgi:transposase/ribonuclease HI